ncbi:hypothetical protein [Nocardia sp. BMG111209]|uniref:hypothetical protein n=1 Tax=Nocardia sp. BMG111209 TaxID=1160137 RepID=UPI000370A45B|nr:hypothetical protein [Nocardia sp. BMG111209]
MLRYGPDGSLRACGSDAGIARDLPDELRGLLSRLRATGVGDATASRVEQAVLQRYRAGRVLTGDRVEVIDES